MANLLLGLLILGPLLLGLLLKSNGALSFLSLCAGSVIVTYGGSDISIGLKRLGFGPYSTAAVELVLLIAPLAITLLVTKKVVASRKKYYFHGVAILAAGGLLALSAVPLLNDIVNADFSGSQIWVDLQKAQAWIVGIGVFISLMTIWSKALKHTKSKKH